MTPYVVIGIIILGLGVLRTYALRRARETRDDAWTVIAVGTAFLETQARAARDQQIVRDRDKPN